MLNPAKIIWDLIDSVTGKNANKTLSGVSQNTDEGKQTLKSSLISDFKGFLVAVESKDWGWVFRGKTGLFLKISIPVLIILLIISSFIPKQNDTTVVVKPTPVDLGDVLDKPKFVNSNYITSTLSDGKFLVYSKDAGVVNEFGVRGILLYSSGVDSSYSYFYPINKKSYLFIKDSKLDLLSVVKEPVKNKYPVTYEDVEYRVTIIPNIESPSQLIDLHKNYDNTFSFTYNNTFYVYSNLGELIKQFTVNDSFIKPTYYGGEIYYIKKVVQKNIIEEATPTVQNSSESFLYYLIKLNTNNEEIYSQLLGNNPISKLVVVNEDRFLLIYEKPSEKSFFNIQMRDSGERTIFNIVPKETDVKITKIDSAYFSANDNTVFIMGNGVSKLFNLNGEQLWIN